MRVPNMVLELLSVYLDLGVIKFSDVEAKRTNVTSQDLSKYQRVDIGDFVLNNQQAWRGSVGVSNHRGIVSPAYLVLELSKKLNKAYANYMFRSGYMVGQYLINSKGVGTIQRNLYWPSLRRAVIILPPLPEQTRIAAFLDDKTAKIDRAIAQKEQMIALLKERKQIVIQNAVTGKLKMENGEWKMRPQAEMKHSGVEWIGDIPEGWVVEQSQWLFSERKERARKNDIQLTSSQKFGVIPQDEYMLLEGRRVTVVEFNREIQKHVEIGDFMISMRSFQGGLEYSNHRGCISSAYIPLIPSEKIDHDFYKYLFKCQRYIEALQSTSNLVRDGQALRFDNFKQIPLIIVPLQEQQRIANFLDLQTTKIENVISLQERQIEKLKELKASLIDGAVTGKIKVF